MRHRVRTGIAVWIALLMLAMPSSFGQSLHLPNSVQPPSLPRLTSAGQIWAVLESEAVRLIEQEHDAAGLDQLVLRARINLRIIGADLLARGDEAGAEGSAAVNAGFRLARGREQIDAVLQGLLESSSSGDAGVAARSEARLALVRFNEATLELVRLPPPTTPAQVDQNLHSLLRHLGIAVERLTGTNMQSRWPSQNVVRDGSPVGTAAFDSVPRLRERVRTSTLPDETRAVMLDIVRFLDEGSAFADLRELVERYQLHLTRALDLADAAAEVTWLRDPQRERYRASLHQAVVLFRDRQTRNRGIARLERLEHTRITIRRIDSLARQRVDLKPIRTALEDAEAFLDSPAAESIGRDRLAKLRLVLDRMIQFRELPEASLKRDLRAAERRLRAAYFEAENELVEQIGRLTTDAGALGDPAFTTLVADQNQSLDDIRRLRMVPTWLETVTHIRSSARDGLYVQFRKMARWLEDPNRRPEASRALAQFERQLDLFYPLPFESELAQPSRSWLAVTGGRHGQLQLSIHEARRDWLNAWARGDASGSDAIRMSQMYRVMQTLGLVATILDADQATLALSQWGGWSLPDEVAARTISRLESRLKVATAAVDAGDIRTLTRHLDEIDEELPLARLVARLSMDLREVLVTYSADATGTLASLLIAPGSDAWWLDNRQRLAQLCRYAQEQEYATANGDDEAAEAIAAYVNATARDLLIELGDTIDPLPVLMGFDGTDPDGDDR